MEGVMIGLEIHMQLKTDSKLFCGCSASYRDAEPNSNICEVCVSHPGAKPRALNERALNNLLKLAIALNCDICKGEVLIQRKHYFYPDLPSNYQRTSKPIASKGKLGNIGITELHIEEDPGRYELRRGHVDFNRSGVPLVELVTDPDFRSPEEAREFLEELQAITDYLGCIRAEAGGTRIDANISLAGGKRVEVKNINSFKGVYTALKYEITRQGSLLKKGLAIEQETRHFDESQGITIGLRKKETAADYRYIPDPDLLPLKIDEKMIEEIKKSLPVLPRERAKQIEEKYGIRAEDAWLLVVEKDLCSLFENLASKFDAQKLAFWIRGALKKQLNYRDMSYKESGVKEEWVEKLLEKFFAGEITDKVMEKTLIKMLDEKKFEDLEKMSAIKDAGELERIVDEVMGENRKAVEDYKAGAEKAINALAGQVMRKTKGRADSKIVMELLKKKLEKGN